MNGTGVSAVTAYTAHREWASRPPDERYASVHGALRGGSRTAQPHRRAHHRNPRRSGPRRWRPTRSCYARRRVATPP